MIFTIILPIYNQGGHIDRLLKTYIKALDKQRFSYELLVVVNGSHDNSYQNAVKFDDGKKVRVFNLKKGGWGNAVSYGMKTAKGKYICYTNSARTNINDLIRILDYSLVNENTLVKASRITRDSTFRKLGSILFNFEARMLFKLPIWDVNGTPKVIPRKIFKKIGRIISKDDLIDLELLYKSYRNGCNILDVPIYFAKRIDGKSTTNISSAIKIYSGTFLMYLSDRKNR